MAIYVQKSDSVQAYRTDRRNGKTPSVPQLRPQDTFTDGNIAKPVKSPAEKYLKTRGSWGELDFSRRPNPAPFPHIFILFIDCLIDLIN